MDNNNPISNGIERFKNTLAEISLNPESFLADDNGLKLSNNHKCRNGHYMHGRIERKNQCVSFDICPLNTCPGMGACGRGCYDYVHGRTYPNVKKLQEHNFASLLINYRAGGVQKVTESIIRAIKSKKVIKVVRIHAGGDFFTKWYLEAWVNVARLMPDVTFYGYSKSFHILYAVASKINWPSNLIINLSVGVTPEGELWHGGLYDEFIPKLQDLGFNLCHVVWGLDEYPELPYNDEERMAITPSKINGGNKPDFKIGIHSYFYPAMSKAHHDAEKLDGVHHC